MTKKCQKISDLTSTLFQLHASHHQAKCRFYDQESTTHTPHPIVFRDRFTKSPNKSKSPFSSPSLKRWSFTPLGEEVRVPFPFFLFLHHSDILTKPQSLRPSLMAPFSDISQYLHYLPSQQCNKVKLAFVPSVASGNKCSLLSPDYLSLSPLSATFKGVNISYGMKVYLQTNREFPSPISPILMNYDPSDNGTAKASSFHNIFLSCGFSRSSAVGSVKGRCVGVLVSC